jgi:hypothetical protein
VRRVRHHRLRRVVCEDAAVRDAGVLTQVAGDLDPAPRVERRTMYVSTEEELKLSTAGFGPVDVAEHPCDIALVLVWCPYGDHSGSVGRARRLGCEHTSPLEAGSRRDWHLDPMLGIEHDQDAERATR